MADSTTRESVLKSNDIAFPRGGNSGLTPLEVKEISNEATRDVLFGNESESSSGAGSKRKAPGSSAQTQKKARRGKKKNENGTIIDEESSDVHVKIENFNFKNMIPGTKVLGQIIKIHKYDMLLALGDNLFGHIPITSISEQLTKQVEAYAEDEQQSSDDEDQIGYDDEDKEITTGTLKTRGAKFPILKNIFSVGQWINAQVVPPKDDSKQQKQIELSIEPSVINKDLDIDDFNPGNLVQAAIVSREDHGLVVDICKSEMTGFIPNKHLKDTKSGDDDDGKFSPGKVILTCIESKPSTRALALKPVEISAKSAQVSTITSVDAIQPGVVVNALVNNVSKNGVVTKVFGLVDGTLNLTHLNEFNHDKLLHKYGVGNNIKARVIAVLLKGGTRKLILSQLSHIMNLSDPTKIHSAAIDAFPIGFKFEEVKIKGIDPNYIYLDLGSFSGQVHLSKVDPSKSVGIDYTVGSSHPARVIGFNSFDNVLVLSLDPQVVDAKYLQAADIPDGAFDKVEVLKVLPNSGGIKVKVYGKFEGFVPPQHMSDIKLSYPEVKFRAGSKVKARVLRKDASKLLVTLKKTLVNLEDDEILNSADKASLGFRTTATVERFVANGAIVGFFGFLKAYLPKNEISETFVDDPKKFLKLGQSVSIKIKSINEEKKLLVTLKQSSEISGTEGNVFDKIIAGKSILETTVVQRTKDSVIVETTTENIKGIIFSGHLSDGNYEQNREIANKLSIGDNLNVLVLEKDLKNKNFIGTCKETLISSSKRDELPSTFSEIQINDKMIYGYIKSVTNMGLFISFGGKLTGLVLAKYVPDSLKDNLSKHFYKYQSIACRVIRIDNENKRFLLSLKDIKPSDDITQSETTVNPVDGNIKFVGEYQPGLVTEGTVKSIKGTQLNIQLADNVQGRIDSTQCFNSWDEIKNKRQPLSQFQKGQKLQVKVIGFHDAKTHKFLPITHRKSNKHTILELSALKDTIASKTRPLDFSDIKEGDKQIVFANNIANGFVFVTLTPSIKGRISFMELSDDVSLFKDLTNNLPIGTAIESTVKEIDNDHNLVVLSSRKNIPKSIEDVKEGQKYPARVLKIKDTFVLLSLSDNVSASSFITDALEDYSDKLESVFKPNDYTTATVISVDKAASKVAVSLRSNSGARDKLVSSSDDLKRGDIVRGFIKHVSNSGIHVSLGRSVQAFVRVADLSDSFIKDWKKHFRLHQMVVGKISKNEGDGKITMTFKESEVNGELKTFKKFDDLKVGEIYEGSIKSVTDFGVFVKLDGTFNVSGLCHHSEIADNSFDDLKKLFGEGDRVKVKILKIDSEKKQLSLGMKASYFTEDIEMEDGEVESSISHGSDEEAESENDNDLADEDDMNEDDNDSESSESDSDSSIDNGNDDDEVIDVEEADESSEEDDEEGTLNQQQGLSTGGFDWTASILDQADNDENESSEDEDDFMEKKKKKRSKVRKYAEDKTGDINTRAPQSTADFERLIIGNPNSSILWMNYMSFQLQLSELDKAREIGERALKTINYTEEEEKLNIWIALLNLENSFGTDESLEEVFKRSCQYMDSLTMHQKLASIFIMSENYEKVDELYKKMFKKFGPDNVQIWVNYASNLLDRKLNDQCHEVLAKALQSLPKRDHIEVVKKFAQLEYEKGEIEQGRSLFEGLVNDAPKRIDIWNVYIDKEIKFSNDKSKVEDLFERVITKKLSKKQAKFFFNKWVEFEDDHDDEKGSLRVKAKAAEYAESLNKV